MPLFKDIGKFLKNLWAKLLPNLKKAIHIGVTIVNAIKSFDNSFPVALDTITALIPGTWDDALKVQFRKWIPEIAIGLGIADKLLNPEQATQKLIEHLNTAEPAIRATTLNSMGILLSMKASDGQLPFDQAVHAVKYYYDNQDELEPLV